MPYVIVFLLFFVALLPRDAQAHLASFGSWEITEKHLKTLFPDAATFRVKRTSFSPSQVENIERELGFKLYPEDKNPTFYVALKDADNPRSILGVAMFIDPRVESTISDATVRLEVGIAVGRRGQIHRVRVLDYRGDPKLMSPKFADQLNGLTLKSNFVIDTNERLTAIDAMEKESQLVANAAKEALYLMKISLGKKKK